MKTYALRVENPMSVLGKLVRTSVNSNTIQDAYTVFVSALTEAIQECTKETVNIELHAFDDLEKAKKAKIKSDVRYLTLDSQGHAGIPLGVSRRFDYGTSKQLGITTRPGFDELKDQIVQIKKLYGNEFCLIEDDVYTGGTLKYIIGILTENEIYISSIITGVSSTRTISKHQIDTCIYYEPDNLLELTDPRDYIFGAQHGGLVVSLQNQKFRVPYCAPFVDIQMRSSIAQNQVNGFTGKILHANYSLHKTIGSLDVLASNFYPDVFFKHHNLDRSLTLGQLLDGLKSVYKQ